MSYAEVAQTVGIVGGILVIGGGLISVIFFALRRKWREEEGLREENLLKLTEQERDLYKRMADRVPELETQVKVLREEVGAAKAIAALEANMQAGFSKMAATLDAMDRRGQKHEERQARYDRGTIDGLNRLLAVAHEQPIRFDVSDEHR